MSSPIECNSPTITAAYKREYCHLKFNQLTNFINNKELSKENNNS
jgi:hypothetical protein